MVELFQTLLEEANKAMKTADHLVYVTFPLINDIKLIVTITENLNKALVLGMEAVLQHEYLYKRIGYVPKDFREKMEMFKSYCIPRYNIERDSLLLISDIKDIIEHRRNSPTEFIRSNKFVMCTSDYKMRVLNYDKVKRYNLQCKDFISKVNGILGKR